MSDDWAVSPAVVSEMVTTVSPAAAVDEVRPAEGGHLPVYHVTLTTPDGPRDWVLKVAPDGDGHGVDAEGRLLSLVNDRTSIPAPTVVGAVDAHDVLPTPFFVMAAADGERVPKREIGSLSDAALETLARESGRHLADLHSVAGPAGYGLVDVDRSASLTGERPSVAPDQLTVSPLQGGSAAVAETWPAVLRAWTETALERHGATRFGDLTEAVGATLRERVDSLEGPFPPVLGRVDHGLHNVLLDPETGAVTGVIDWGFTLSVPAAYDLACVEANLATDPWSVHPETPNRRAAVGTALLDGYRERGRSAVVDRYGDHRSTYELLALVRGMTQLDSAPETTMPGATPAQVDAAAAAYRETVAAALR